MKEKVERQIEEVKILRIKNIFKKINEYKDEIQK